MSASPQKNQRRQAIFRRHETKPQRQPITGGYVQLHRKQVIDGSSILTATSKVWEQWEDFTINGTPRIRIRERRVYSFDTWSTALPSPATAPASAISRTTWDYNRNVADPASYGRASQRREYVYDAGGTAVQTQWEDYTYQDFTGYTLRSSDRGGPGYTERTIRYEYPPPTTFPRDRWPAPPSYTYRYILKGGTLTLVGITAVSATVSGSDMLVTTTEYLGTAEGNIVTENYYHGSSAAAPARWKPKATKHPDGTWSLYSYTAGSETATTGEGQ